ncbi:MAG TPA: hypothetical protein VNZ45_06275 [Bacteroidia bacterium]|jgi:hypothetical protein|nr:hypothetical protein [Bacteroidia bacterium]
MKTKAVRHLIVITILVIFSFQNSEASSGRSVCKIGTMEVRDTGCSEATAKRFCFGKDTIELPDCITYPCTGKMFMEKDSTGHFHMVSTIKHLPVDEPFYFRKDVYVFIGITPEQEKELDWFKDKVMHGVKDTALRAELWFQLSSIKYAMKNNDAISYIIGLRHLTEAWKKIYPAQFYDK